VLFRSYNFLVEPLKNANFHGGRKDKIEFELFLSPLSLLASFNDGGTYFKRQEIKDAWESRVFFPERHEANVEGIGGGAGTMFIYELSDFIYVDTSMGTLYTGRMTKNFCVPFIKKIKL
jgi:hypothetical protein